MSRNSEKVSIILPSLNVEPYIEKALESVCKQTLHDIEILCIDAGSTDGTRQIIEKYQKKDSRVLLIESEKKSYGYQVNLGIKKAKGKYIGIVETDDYIHPDMYKELFDIAEKNNCDYVKADYDSFYDMGAQEQYSEYHPLFPTDSSCYNKVINPSKDNYIFTHDQNLWKGIYSSRFLLDNNIKLNETAGAAYQDVGFSMQVLSFARRGYYSDKSFYRYRMNRDGSSFKSPKALMFVCQELHFLTNDSRWNNGLNARAICNRIALAVRGEFHHLFIQLGLPLNDEKNSSCLDQIRTFYKSFMKDGLWPNVETESADKEAVLQIIYEPETFVESLHAAYMNVEKRKEELYNAVDFTQKRHVIIFGAGAYGKSCCKDLFNRGIRIVAISDNNQKLWGTSLFGIKIVSPAEILNLEGKDNLCFVIANKLHAEEIEKQLIDMGIDKQLIVRYR